MFEAERKRSKPCNFPSLPRALSVYVLCSERKIVPLTITHSRTPQPTFLLTKERERGGGRGAHNSSHCKQHKKGGASETTRFSPPGGEPKELAKQYFPFSERAGEKLARSLAGGENLAATREIGSLCLHSQLCAEAVVHGNQPTRKRDGK